jgi:hypothetical protein
MTTTSTAVSSGAATMARAMVSPWARSGALKRRDAHTSEMRWFAAQSGLGAVKRPAQPHDALCCVRAVRSRQSISRGGSVEMWDEIYAALCTNQRASCSQWLHTAGPAIDAVRVLRPGPSKYCLLTQMEGWSSAGTRMAADRKAALPLSLSRARALAIVSSRCHL